MPKRRLRLLHDEVRLKAHGSKIFRLLFSLAIALTAMSQSAQAACTLGTGACCQNGGGVSDNPATQLVWEPDLGTTDWNSAGNWEPNNVPNASTEYAYIQADWRVPIYPNASYSLSCLRIVSGTMTATPTAPTFTAAVGATATVTVTAGTSGTVTTSIPNSGAVTMVDADIATTVVTTQLITASFSATTDRVTWNNCGLVAGDPVRFTAGTLPPELSTSTVYYVINPAGGGTDNFQLAATPGGAVINAAGATNYTNLTIQRHAIRWTNHGLVAGDSFRVTTADAPLNTTTTYYVSSVLPVTANSFGVSATSDGLGFTNVTGSGGNTGIRNAVRWTAHGLAVGDPVRFAGTMPGGLTAATIYYVAAVPEPTANSFSVTATIGGTFITTTSDGTGNTAEQPSKVNYTAHGLTAGTPVFFSTTGALPTGISPGTVYYVAATPAPLTNSFYLAPSVGGTSITFSGTQSGVHTVTRPGLINWTAHGIAAGEVVTFTNSGGALPTGITSGTPYYVLAAPATTANTFYLSGTAGGVPLSLQTTGTGTHTGRRPSVFTLTGHGLSAGTPVTLTTTGTLPAGLALNTVYYIAAAPAPAANTFSLAATSDGGPLTVTSTGTGTHSLQGGRVLTITGEFFTNQNAGSLTTGSGFLLKMAGTAEQTLDNVDPLSKLLITNSTTVYMPSTFTVSESFAIASGAGTIKVQSGLTLSNTNDLLTIPASATLEIQNGAVLTAAGGIEVSGVLKISAGGSVLIGNGKSMTVKPGGVLQIIGNSGAVAKLDAIDGSSSFALNVQGSINANYFSISRTTAPGLNITTAGSDSIQTISNGEFHYLASGGFAITLNTAKNLPSSPNPTGLGFFDDYAFGNIKNFQATAYTGTAVTVSDWSGFGDTAYETDPGNKINWGSQAPVGLQLANATAGGNPPATIGRSSSDTLFATFAFSLNGVGTASDITSITFTLGGTNAASDVASAKVYADTSANCVYNAGVDTQIGSNLTFVNNPAVATLSLGGGVITLSDTTPKCIHVLLATSSNARLNSTLQVKIASTEDVVNSQNYQFPSTNGPPVQGPISTVTVGGVSTKIWGGGNAQNGAAGATNWDFNTQNWTPTGLPATTDDCQIGPAYSYPVLNGNRTCNNVTLPDSGRLSWNNTTNVFTVLGSLEIGSSYNFTTATNGNITFASTTANQSIYAETTFPGGVTINNSAGSGTVTVNSDFSMTGDLTLSAGTLRITAGNTLTVAGNINVNGGTLKIDPGAYLILGDGRTLTVGASGTLEIVGNSSQPASFSCTGTTTGCAVSVSGTIKAQYYSFNRLAVAGVTIGSGATIDATHYLQNGAFTYPIGTNPVMITLNRQVPGNAWDNMTFDLDGSPATGAQSVVTGGAVAAGTLTIDAYSGNLTGDAFDTDPSYIVTWATPTTTLKLASVDASGTVTITIANPGVVTYTSHGLIAGASVVFSTTGALPTGLAPATTYYVAASPAPTTNTFSVTATLGGAAINTSGTQSGVHTATSGANNTNQGDTALRAGWWSFQQTDPGVYDNTDLTSVKVTLDGTGSSSDVSSARLYYDAACSGSGGTQVGTALTFSGSPPSITFSGLTGVTVQSDLTSPPQRCVYIEFDVASAATSGATLIAKIGTSGDVVNSEGYSFNGSFAPPKSGRTLTIIGNTVNWTGAVSTDWFNPLNWSPNTIIPDATRNCVINNATNSPIINAVGAVCKSVTIGNGTLTINSGQTLSVYGSLTNTGTIIQGSATATITILDDGSTVTNQTLQSSSALDYLVFNKTAGGYVYIGNNNLTINHFEIPASQNFIFNVRNGDTLTLPDAATLSSATFQVDGGSTVAVAPSTTFTVAGGTLKLGGVNDGYPQLTSNKATMTHSGGGTGRWSFVATSGNLDLDGWLVEWLTCPGMQITGTTNVPSLAGGQLREIPSPSFCAPSDVYGIQMNTTGTLPSGADYVGFNWGPDGSPPDPSETYYLLASTGCSNQTVNFTNWFGDFQFAVGIPDPATKVSMTNCGATISNASSPVSLSQAFKAEPYNGVVRLLWQTGQESAHRGFNIYRSVSPSDGYAQVNPTLIRNPIQSGTVHGNYDFRDSGVTNGVTYYYRLEDIAVNGKRKFHGPVSATPLNSLGVVPAASSGAIVSTNTSGGGAPSLNDTTPGIVTVAPGVTQLAKTKNSLRLRIDVPAFVRSASDMVGYDQLAIEGYASTTEGGKPELPERVVLVEVPGADAASFAEVSRTASDTTSIDIVAARTWTVVNGALISSREIDTAFYTTNQSLPSEPVEFQEIVENQGLYYLPIVVRPVKYNPVTRVANAISQITFDVHLSGAPNWNVGAPVTESGPWGYEGGLKIHLRKSGMYKLSYSDLVAAGVDGPFAGANVDKLRLFSKMGELPLQVLAAGANFSPGDEIRFFAPYFDVHTSDRNSLVLYVDSVNGLRMDDVDGTPTNVDSTQTAFRRRIELKNASIALFNEPIADNVEHIYWGRIYAPETSPGDASLKPEFDLPNLASTGHVLIRLSVKGGKGAVLNNPVHHLGLYVNGSASSLGDHVFQSNQPYSMEFTVPASMFVAGRNQIEVRVLGDLVPSGDYDVVNIERMTVDYPHTFRVDSGFADIQNTQAGKDMLVDGLSSGAIAVYDISQITGTALISNAVITDNDGIFAVKFATTPASSSLGRRLVVVADSAVFSPWALELNQGSNWKGLAQGADVLYIGPRRLLSAAARLAEWRRSNGARTALVPTEDIFMEFGQGVRSPQAIKDFIAYSIANWQAPAPKYVVLIGDASLDPKNQLGYGLASGVPTYFSKGQAVDYGNDNFYVALTEGSDAPALAIGRIPGGTVRAVETYIEKVITYESGATSPTGDAAQRFTLLSDTELYGGEKFDEKAERLASLLPGQWNQYTTVNLVKRSVLGDAAFKNAILNSFNNGALFIHFLGHGAENVWSDLNVFNNDDAEGLTNTQLPIVVAMNCLNGMYYDADPATLSLADKLLFNGHGGAVAMFASTTLTVPDLQVRVQDALYEYIVTHPEARLGDSVRMAKLRGGSADITGSWTLFGDPMLKVKIPSAGDRILASVPGPSANAPAASSSGSCAAVHSAQPAKPGLGAMLNVMILILALLVGRLAMARQPKRVPVKVKARRKS